jgi:nucleotide-binding universal stress UspA family protein
MFRKVLCPLDFSPSSQHAMRVAIRLADAAGAELVLAHASHVPAMAFAGEATYPAGAIGDMVSDEEQALAVAMREAEQLGAQRLSSRFLTGPPWEQLCDVIRADPAFDLAVMGTHGRTGFRRILLGSVTEKVVRHAPCSVLAVRGRDGTDDFRHVLCPIDFSDSSRPAVALAAELAARDGLGITLLHVLQLAAGYPGDPATLAFVAELDRDATRLLGEWAAALRARVPVPVATRLLVGSPAAQTLIALDSEVTFDLVVVGSHGRTGLDRVLLGSVAEQLVRHAPCPVLVARHARLAGEGSP